MRRALVAFSISFLLLSPPALAEDLHEVYDEGDRVALQLQGANVTAPPLVIDGWPTTLQLAELLGGKHGSLLAVVPWSDAAWTVTKHAIDSTPVVARRLRADPGAACAPEGCDVQAGDPRR